MHFCEPFMKSPSSRGAGTSRGGALPKWRPQSSVPASPTTLCGGPNVLQTSASPSWAPSARRPPWGWAAFLLTSTWAEPAVLHALLDGTLAMRPSRIPKGTAVSSLGPLSPGPRKALSLAQGLTWRCTPTLCLSSITLGRKWGRHGTWGHGRGQERRNATP